MKSKINIKLAIVLFIFTAVYSIGVIGYSDIIGAKLLFKSDFFMDIPSFLIIFLLIVIISLSTILYLLIEEFHNYSTNSNNHEMEMDLEENNCDINIDAFNKTEFQKEVFYVYNEIEKAYMSFDYEKLKSLLTPELFNKYKTDLDNLKENNFSQIIDNLMIENIKIEDCKEFVDHYEICISLNVNCIDYIIDSENILVKGDMYKSVNYKYEMVFVKNKKIKDLKECPYCHKELKNSSSNKCPYCGEIILNDTTHLIVSEKKLVVEI